MNKVEELKKYKELLDDGIITQEEFDLKKNELLKSDISDQSTGESSNAGVVKTTNKRIPLIVGIAVGIVVLAVALVVVLGRSKKKDFNDMYEDLAGKRWCTIASDGSYMKIDTNPLDIEDHVEFDAWNSIKSINIELGFSESLQAKMESTNSLSGRQSESNDKYEVSWTYHPDNGLEVIYTIK